MAALTIRQFRKRFGALDVLNDIDLDIEDGEFVVLVGPSGCGKSTLLNMIAGLEEPSEGSIAIGGRAMNGVAPKDRDIAMVFQSYALYPTMTVRQNITFGMECRRIPRVKQAEALARVAAPLQIEELLDRKPGQQSGGQRQRVAMGRALVRDPVLFLFDEPLSNLDAKLRMEMRAEIKRLHARIGSTIVYVTHDQVEAMTMATRIAVMYRGEVQQFADPDTIYNRPANLFVARFMGSPPMNALSGRVAERDGMPFALIGDGRPSTLELPLPSSLDRAHLDRKVVVGIRPECITARGHRFGHEGRVGHSVTARVEMVETTGAETVVCFDLAGQVGLGRLPPDMRLQIGEMAELTIDAERIRLFDPTTERALACTTSPAF